MSKVRIAEMTMKHIDEVMVVEHLSFTIPWSKVAFIEEVTRNQFAVYIVATLEEKVIGYAGMWKVCDEGHITNIAVHPEFRQNGVGSLLVQSLVDMSKKDGILRMTLEVRKSNFAAQKLYMKFGFKNGGLRKAYYSDNGEDAIIMWKEEM